MFLGMVTNPNSIDDIAKTMSYNTIKDKYKKRYSILKLKLHDK